MLWIFLLLIINSVKSLTGADHETLCTSDACFTLHMNKVKFAKAQETCVHNGGYLMTVRDTEEENILHSLLSQIRGQHQERAVKVWIGLKLNRGTCVVPGKTLKGFKWISGDEDSHYSNWAQEPVSTCTERCVKVNYAPVGQNQLKWMAGACKSTAFYACKFYFKGMCKPLALIGPGVIMYTMPFSNSTQRGEMELFPLGTYADIMCSDQEPRYTVCDGLDNTFQWTRPGPFCKSGERSCAVHNGGCEDTCRQDGESVQCLCREGYSLDADELSCRVRDLCTAAMCEHECVLLESGFSCTCPHGFKLDRNERTCSDIDECQSQVCSQDQLCVNTNGSYTCECKRGFEMVAGKCTDVDECAMSRCEHSCLNNVGSFSCHCLKGFSLSQDGLLCMDVDECITHRCQFTCVNDVGSFSCICPSGFHLDTDQSTCSPDVAETSAAPSGDKANLANFTQFLMGTTVELQHQSPHTPPPPPVLENVVHGQPGNVSVTPSSVKPVSSRVLVCVLGSVIPLIVLIALTIAIAIFRCNRSKKEAKKKTTTDGYCWVSSGLDPRLEKLYESISTDDL